MLRRILITTLIVALPALGSTHALAKPRPPGALVLLDGVTVTPESCTEKGGKVVTGSDGKQYCETKGTSGQ